LTLGSLSPHTLVRSSLVESTTGFMSSVSSVRAPRSNLPASPSPSGDVLNGMESDFLKPSAARFSPSRAIEANYENGNDAELARRERSFKF